MNAGWGESCREVEEVTAIGKELRNLVTECRPSHRDRFTASGGDAEDGCWSREDREENRAVAVPGTAGTERKGPERPQ